MMGYFRWVLRAVCIILVWLYGPEAAKRAVKAWDRLVEQIDPSPRLVAEVKISEGSYVGADGLSADLAEQMNRASRRPVRDPYMDPGIHVPLRGSLHFTEPPTADVAAEVQRLREREARARKGPIQ